MEHVILLLKGRMECPPILMLAYTLRDLGHRVTAICSFAQATTKADLAARDIRLFELYPHAVHGPAQWEKLRHWQTFHTQAWHLLEREGRDSLLWTGSADTALALGSRLQRYPHVMQIRELYDHLPLYRHLMAPYARRARAVVVPEACRAAIFRVWFQLDQIPFVVPNKPYHFPLASHMEIPHDGNRQKLAEIAGRKLVLYQAQNARMDTIDIARALQNLGPEYVLGLLGRIHDQAMFARLTSTYPDLVHFDFMPAPHHLTITSHAHIGVLVYDYRSLNNVFCAPNKVWEYSALQLPMLCNELPMLSQQLRQYHAGESFRLGDVDSIIAAISRIDNDYIRYQAGTRELFTSVDTTALIEGVMHAVVRQ